MDSLRLVVASLALSLTLAAAGCGSPPPPAMPTPVLGNYSVVIEANGRMDDDRMYVTIGSANNILLNFLYGISQVRGTLTGSTDLSLPRQTLHVQHSIGVADGVATGGGKFVISPESGMAEDVDFTITLTTAGFGPADGGGSGLGGSGAVDYHITGTRN